jgi:hypothetical protein
MFFTFENFKSSLYGRHGAVVESSFSVVVFVIVIVIVVADLGRKRVNDAKDKMLVMVNKYDQDAEKRRLTEHSTLRVIRRQRSLVVIKGR